MKNFLKNIIIFLIQLIEKYQYRNKKFSSDENDMIDKFIDIIFTKDILVETEYGFVPIQEINVTKPLQRYKLLLENGLYLEAADNHLIFCDDYQQKFLCDLNTNDVVLTKRGPSRVKSVKKIYGKISMFDLSVDSQDMSYYSNDILSHNTVSAAIFMLHFLLFNNDKNIMVVANKSTTVKEIVRKIKDIYKLLPFFLKKGVINWNEKTIAFDNGSRLQSENRTTEPAIGFTIDLLYLDEFAKVPANIIEPYYMAVVPTVSSVKNSKIIITSTPDGFNLFHDLLINAERDEDDPLKNPYSAMRVYWYQIKGRRDTKIRFLAYKLKKYDLTEDVILKHFNELGFKTYNETIDNKNFIKIKYDIDVEKTHIDQIRKMRIGNIPLTELALITNWQEEETKLIGGEDAFKQEYDLHFITGNKLLFTSEELERFKLNSNKFEFIPMDILDRKIKLPSNNLKWLVNKPDIFDVKEMKNYYICASIDLGEGLGQDYSVLNIFRLIPKSEEKIEKTYEKLSNLYEYFQIEQIGMFRVNNWSIQEFAEMIYVVLFDLFDSEKVKVVLEYNTYGATLLAHLPHVFEDKNDFSNGIFLRFKHKKEDQLPKIGVKITTGEHEASKKIMVKTLQDVVKKDMLVLHNDVNINEIGTFIKKETPSGDFTYRCENGHDDTVMSLVTLSNIFSHVHFKNMIDHMMESNVIPINVKNVIEKYAYNKVDPEAPNYKSTSNNYSKVYGQKKYKPIQSSPWSNSINRSPWSK